MKPYEATEAAYKNGYKKGYEDGKRDVGNQGRWVVKQYGKNPGEYTCHCPVCQTEGSLTWKCCPVCETKMSQSREVSGKL